MSRYNHFRECKYERITFSSLAVGDRFRKDFFRKGRRINVVCIKAGSLSYIEERGGQTHSLHHSEGYMVFSLEGGNAAAEVMRRREEKAVVIAGGDHE